MVQLLGGRPLPEDLNVEMAEYPDHCNSDYCNANSYYIPICETPLDTIWTIGSKNVSIEKMGWIDLTGYLSDFSLDYIHYYPSDGFIISSDEIIDYSKWKVVDYQRK